MKKPRISPPTVALIFICALAIAALALWVYLLKSPARGLPYRDSFAKGHADEWTAYGGTWHIADGTMRNDSDERGAKLMTGSPRWRNYSFDADVELLGEQGDAGVILRSSDEEQGVDSYSGYYAGLRTFDGNLVVGRADHGWIEFPAKPMPGGLHAFQWYHLRATVYGCQITASARELATGNQQSITINDEHCKGQGRVGLRSHSSGGIWKNIVVLPIVGPPPAMTPAIQSADHRQSGAAADPFAAQRAHRDYEHQASYDVAQSLQDSGLAARAVMHPAQTIGSLSQIRTQGRRATVRGTVILNGPMLYVQDATGGVAVAKSSGPPLKIGDEVEATGEVEPRDFSSVLHDATVRLMWAHAPLPPVSVTAGQAATGRYDARFIEVDGILTGKETGPANALILDLQHDRQSFRAIVDPGRGNVSFAHLRKQSLLRLRGVCVVDPEYTHDLTPFVLLVPSTDDIGVLAGPPWWSLGNLLIIGMVLLVLALVGYLLYLRAKHWRLHAIVEERERLAHEMHDTLAQSFVGIGFQLQAISNGIPEHSSELHEQLNLACDLVRHSHEEARRSLTTLRREFVEGEGLHAALYDFACRMVEHGTVDVDLTTSGDGASVPYRIKDTLVRIGQEAVANAIRHGKPGTLKIDAQYSSAAVMLTVRDDGAGFVPGGNLRGFGLVGIRKRAESISATLNISSTPGHGTELKVTAPLPPGFTLARLPRYLWKFGKDSFPDAKGSKRKDPYSYR